MQSLKILLLILVGMVGVVNATFAQSVHSLSIERAAGQSHSLQSYAGKRVLIIATALDTATDLDGLAALQTKYPDLVVIELPVKQLATSSKKAARSTLSSSVLHIDEVVDSTSTNGELVQWLTKKEGNSHFTINKLQVGQKFFIDEAGQLYGVLPGDFKLSNPRIDAILNKTSIIASVNK